MSPGRSNPAGQPQSNYGKEWMLLVACALARERWRKEQRRAQGGGGGGGRTQGVAAACALAFQLRGREAAWRRARHASNELPPALGRAARHAAAVAVAQAAWRVALAWRALAAAQLSAREQLRPAAATLLQLRWRLAAVALAKRQRRRELQAKQRALRLAKLVSVCQRAGRNALHAKRDASARRQCHGQLQAFCAVKVQTSFRRVAKARLQAIVDAASPDSDDESTDSDEEVERFYLFGREILPAEASARLVRVGMCVGGVCVWGGGGCLGSYTHTC
jgi:hypothetical protein